MIADGNLFAPHLHPWSDLREIKSSCKAGPEGKPHAASYVFTFAGGDVVSVNLAGPEQIEDFLADSRKLAPMLKDASFDFSYDGDASCPAKWLPALSQKPGGRPGKAG